jgi:hypothetical protein
MTAVAGVAFVVAINLLATTAVSAGMSEDFRLVAKAHRDLARYDVVIDVRNEAASLVRAEVKCMEFNRCITAIGTLTVLRTPSWLIAVDQSRHAITITHRTANNDAPSYRDPATLLSAWLRTGAKVDGGDLTPDGRRWTFTPANAREPQADLYTDANTHLVRKLTYKKTDSRTGSGSIDISYVWNDPSYLDPADFNEAKYIVEQGDTVRPANGYANYSLVRADRH